MGGLTGDCLAIELNWRSTGRRSSGERVELSELGDDRWVVRAADHASLADALAAVGRPSERVRVDVDPVRF